MIRLDVQEYCHNCLDFEADVQAPEKQYIDDLTRFINNMDSNIRISDAIVRCAHRNRCAAIKRYLEKEKEKKNE